MNEQKVFTDPRYQPRIESNCHPGVPAWCWLTADGKGLRIECAQCGGLIINLKVKSPTIRRHKSKKTAAEEALREPKKPLTQESYLFCKKHKYYSCIICDRKDGGIGPITK